MAASEDERLLERATGVRANAYAPYSNFQVGAAVLCRSGAVYGGCNVENSAYPAGMCAERAALATAIAAGEREIVRLAVIADSPGPVAPCGMCRQVIAELAPRATILLANVAGDRLETTPEALLPGAFTAQDLARGERQAPRGDT